MSNLLEELDRRVDNTIETIELLRLQIDELEEKYNKLTGENDALKGKQSSWEQNLSVMLQKLNAIDAPKQAEPSQPAQIVRETEAEAEAEPA